MSSIEHERRITFCFQCPESLYRKFKDLVNDDERSIAWTLRKLIEQYVNEKTADDLHG